MVKYIFLDIDNTLLSFDEYVKESMRSGFRKFGLPEYKEEMYDVFLRHNIRLWSAIERGEITLPELEQVRWNDIFSELGIDFDGVVFEEYFKQELKTSAIIIDGAPELLEKLHERFILCAASNAPVGQQEQRLEKAGMLQYFDYMFISEAIGHSKPDRAFFEHCLTRLNVTPDQIVMVGDSLSSDMAGAVSMGMHTCFYNPTGRQIPENMPIEYAAQTLSELGEWITKNF